MRAPYTRIEQALAWGGLTAVAAVTIAAVWLAAGTVAGLLALVIYATATAWCAATGNLVSKGALSPARRHVLPKVRLPTVIGSPLSRTPDGDSRTPLVPAPLVLPVADLSTGRWRIWVCSRCLKPEREFPADTRQQIEGMRKGTWPTAGMSRDRWPNTCHCGGVVREIEVMTKPPTWSCPGCGEDLGSPECADCAAAYAMDDLV